MQAQTEALAKEVQANQDIHRQLVDLQHTSEETIRSLEREVTNLRAKLSRVEDEAGWKQDLLLKEKNVLQERLQSAEIRNEDLAASVQESTKPLLRQMESLQLQHNMALKTWESVEINLSERIQQCENEKSELSAKLRMMGETVKDLVYLGII